LHSNRRKIHWTFMVGEILVFILALVSVYLSENNFWQGFTYIAIVSVVLFTLLKIFESVPTLKELFVRESFAAEIADAAGQYGVDKYFNMQSSKGQSDRNEMTQEAIKSANSLWLCANSGASYLEPSLYRHWPFIEKKLDQGIEFRVVLLDPFSDEKKFRNKLNSGGEHIDSKMNLANIINAYNKYNNLEIRFVKQGMHCTVFATETCLFVDPYQVATHGGRIDNRSFAMRITQSEPPEGRGLYRIFKSHFDTLWRSSDELSEWVKASADKLPEGLPEVKERL